MKFLNQRLEESLLVALLGGMVVLIGLQVFMRYVVNASLSWSEELARYMFIWATYVGVSFGVRQRAHIRVTAGIDWLGPRARLIVDILTHLVFAAFAAIVIWQGVVMAQKIARFGQTSSSLGIPMTWVYAAPIAGFALVILRLAQQAWADLQALLSHDPEAAARLVHEQEAAQESALERDDGADPEQDKPEGRA